MSNRIPDSSTHKIVGRACKKCGEFIPIYVYGDAHETVCKFCGHRNLIIRYMTVKLRTPKGE